MSPEGSLSLLGGPVVQMTPPVLVPDTEPETGVDMGSEQHTDPSVPDPSVPDPNLDMSYNSNTDDTGPDLDEDNDLETGLGEQARADPGSQALDSSQAVPEATSGSEDGVRPPDEEPGHMNFDELSDIAKMEDIKTTLGFISALECASLDDTGLDPETLKHLRDPPQEPVGDLSPDLRLALDIFIAVGNASQETYNAVCKAILRRYPDDELLSYDQIKRRVAQLSGITPLIRDMCVNSCVAYTGPFSRLDACPECGELRYDPIKLATSGGKTKVARQEFHTMPIGPQLQALWRNADSAVAMRYREARTKEIMEELEQNGGLLATYNDFLHGTDYLKAVADGRIKSTDVVLMFSIDGAQLYRNKKSDCWIAIWVIFDHSPDGRYKVKRVQPGCFIPGPNKPKNSDSFLFPSLCHLVALQREGLRIWDASRGLVFVSHPFLALATADGPGMTYLNGLVGHHGKQGCRLYCSVAGRHKPGGGHYYPALLKPDNYNVNGSNHGDVNPRDITPCAEKYSANLRYLIASPNENQYKNRRLETGISKPSIFLGIPKARVLGVPGCFGSDIMHLVALNLPDLLINLWRGTFDCDKSDSRTTWDWATLQGDTWKAHGAAVAAATPYLPGSFDRPPRNPAEKINSGFKAWEFLLYMYGLGPGLLFGILPDKYWRNYCKLVFGIRIIHQYTIETTDLCQAHQALVEFAVEFEQLYYRRQVNRLHFVRPSIHGVLHLAPEAIRIGPGLCSSQWTMERTIGNLGEEIQQPSNPYQNLSRRGLRRCQINALKAMVPDLEEPVTPLPRGSKDVGDGYVLLRAVEKHPKPMRNCEVSALGDYLRGEGVSVPLDWCPLVLRWARMRLPNGQVARSAFKEKLKPLEKIRTARNVKVGVLY
jgi:hypothetical protein